jgi:four helix bundle protein
MNESEFKQRTRQVALRVIRLVNALPDSTVSQVIGKQLIRSGTSIGANYRAACRGKSRADLAHKLSIVEEEADESLHWIELLVDANLISQKKVLALCAEINEIIAMTVASIKTIRKRIAIRPESKIQNPKSKIR